MEQVNIGIIGGSGLYQMPELKNVREQELETPFGNPSDAFIIGELEGVKVAFLARHGRGIASFFCRCHRDCLFLGFRPWTRDAILTVWPK